MSISLPPRHRVQIPKGKQEPFFLKNSITFFFRRSLKKSKYRPSTALNAPSSESRYLLPKRRPTATPVIVVGRLDTRYQNSVSHRGTSIRHRVPGRPYFQFTRLLRSRGRLPLRGARNRTSSPVVRIAAPPFAARILPRLWRTDTSLGCLQFDSVAALYPTLTVVRISAPPFAIRAPYFSAHRNYFVDDFRL